MARSQIVKFRLSPVEFDALNGRLKGAETLSAYIRDQLGIDGNPKPFGLPQTKLPPAGVSQGRMPVAGKRCPHPGYCTMRKGRYCALSVHTPACHLGAEAWELL